MVSDTFFIVYVRTYMYFVSLLDLTINLHIYESVGGLFPSMDVNCPPSIYLPVYETMGTVSIHGC